MPEPDAGDAAGGWLDWQRAMALVADDEALLVHLVGVFVRQYAQGAAELRAALNAADWTDLVRRAHKLAGAAGAIGAVALERLAREAEGAAQAMVQSGNNHDVQHRSRLCMDVLIEHLERTLRTAGAWHAAQGRRA